MRPAAITKPPLKSSEVPPRGASEFYIVKYLHVAFALARFVLIAAIMPFAVGWRTPLFAGWRYSALAALIILPLILIAFEFWMLRGTRKASRALPRVLRF